MKGPFTKLANILVSEKNDKAVHEVMHTEYAYIKLKLNYLRWAVTPNGQSLVYVNVIQNGRLEHVPDCVSSPFAKDS